MRATRGVRRCAVGVLVPRRQQGIGGPARITARIARSRDHRDTESPKTRQGDDIARFTIRVAALIGAVLALQLPALLTTPTFAGLPPYKIAFFNSPLTGQNVQTAGTKNSDLPVPGAPSSITTAVVGLLESAASGATINIAMYEADNGRVTNVSADTTLIKQAIMSAAKRVHAINILTDGAIRENQRFWNQLADVVHVHVERCDHSCYYSGHSVMHNKFMTVDNTTWTPGDEDVVLQMTSNWRNPQLSSRLWNSALQLWGDRALYDGYARYFSRLWACAPSCHGRPTPRDFGGRSGSGVHVALFPRPTSEDPVLTELNDLRNCVGGEVDIAMNGWVLDDRGEQILRRLESLVAHGCFVRIEVRRTPGSRDMGSTLRARRLAAMSHCTDGKPSRMDTTHLTPAVHSKYILIRGDYRGIKGSTVVSTGSERFVSGSLNRADETWVTVTATPTSNPDNAAVYAAYEANFNAMWASTPAC